MQMRVEPLALRIDTGNAVLFEEPLHFPLGKLDALDQRLQRPLGAVALPLRQRAQRPADAVGSGEHVAGESGDRILAGVGQLPRRALSDVVNFGRGAQQLLAKLGLFGLQPRHRICGLGAAVSRRLGAVLVSDLGVGCLAANVVVVDHRRKFCKMERR